MKAKVKPKKPAKKKPAEKCAISEVNAEETADIQLKLAGKTKQAMQLVIDHGVDPRKALMMVTGNPAPHRNTVNNFKKKCAKWSIEHPSTQKIAHKTLAAFASGQGVNGIEPKSIDVRAAAERIIDQCTPVVRQVQNMNLNVDFAPVDLSRYLSDTCG